MQSKTIQKCFHFFKKEIVLCAAVILALLSCIFVPPSAAYFSYIDWDTLFLLFSLMSVMKGFQQLGAFIFLGNSLLKRTNTTRKLLLVLIFLPFVCSTIVTNDVSLITFVPFGLTVLKLAGREQLAAPVVVLQTLAANLGSMLTPMGNPQNLYLYAKSGMGFGSLCLLMLPYVAISGLLLLVDALLRKSLPVVPASVPVQMGSKKILICCTLGFVLCLLGIFDLIPPGIIAGVILLFFLFADRSVLRHVDYSLLGTFFAFFIFTGNLGALPGFKETISSFLSGHVELTAIATSQVISNVPAALLLSGFTSQWDKLIVGCNLGGLGTLIASMASLISYKFFAEKYPGQRRRYLLMFTLYNLAYLALLFTTNLLIRR